jgi:RNA-binding protein 15
VSHYYDNDEKDATCTLFVGNVDHNTDRMDLRKCFEAYGIVEDVEIKRHMPVQVPNSSSSSSYPRHHEDTAAAGLTKTYSFVKYEDMDMAVQAKRHLNGKTVGSSQIKIGYGNTKTLFISSSINTHTHTHTRHLFAYNISVSLS